MAKLGDMYQKLKSSATAGGSGAVAGAGMDAKSRQDKIKQVMQSSDFRTKLQAGIEAIKGGATGLQAGKTVSEGFKNHGQEVKSAVMAKKAETQQQEGTVFEKRQEGMNLNNTAQENKAKSEQVRQGKAIGQYKDKLSEVKSKSSDLQSRAGIEKKKTAKGFSPMSFLQK